MQNFPIDAPDSLLAGIYAAAEILIKLANAEGTPPRQDFDAPLDGSHKAISTTLLASAEILLKIEGRKKVEPNAIPPEVKAAIEAKADTVVEHLFAPLSAAIADLEQSWSKPVAARLRRVTAELVEADMLTAEEAKPFLDLAERVINDVHAAPEDAPTP